MLSLGLGAALLLGTCPQVQAQTPVVLAVTTADAELEPEIPPVQDRLRALLERRVTLLPLATTQHALTAESGADERGAKVLRARVRLEQAESQFKDLDDEAALAAVAQVSADLVSVHQEPQAIEVLARAHVLAAAIYLARGAGEAVQARLHRALDLDPQLSLRPDRYDPRLIAQLAATRQSREQRATGRLEVHLQRPWPGAQAYLDGQPIGPAPLTLDAVPVGRHLLRVSADGARSHLSSIRIENGETHLRRVHLRDDPGRHAMEQLASTLRSESAQIPDQLRQLADRAPADQALVAELILAPRLSAHAAPVVAVRLWSSTGGTGWAPDARAESLAVAVSTALGCSAQAWPPRLAPALIAPQPPLGSLDAVPKPQDWWQAPWVWAVATGLVLGAAGAMVAARASSGPPESLSITLVPRP